MSSTTTAVSSSARLLLLLPLLLLLASLVLLLGAVPIAPEAVVSVLAGGGEEPARTIILDFRLPRVITAILAGASLGLSGLLMQTFFRNPLAGPGVLGVTSGAGLFVALAVLSGVAVFGGSAAGTTLSGLASSGAAILGATAVLLLILLVHRLVSSATTLLVLGVLFGYASSALVTLLMAASSAESLQRFVRWSYGSFDIALGPVTIAVALALTLSVAALIAVAPSIDALLLGPRYALSSGVRLSRVQPLLLLIAGVLTGLVTALCGPITFIGVAVPHLTRLYLGRSLHRTVVPGTLLIGATVAVAADLISHLPGIPGVLPVNAVTSIIGVPVIVAVIFRPGSGRREVEL